MRGLVYTVYVNDEKGTLHCFGPGDDLPDWAKKRITNPLAFGDTLPASNEEPVPPAPESTASAVSSGAGDPPPQGGPGASRKAWEDYATAHGVAIEDGWKRDDIIDACQAQGIPV